MWMSLDVGTFFWQPAEATAGYREEGGRDVDWDWDWEMGL